MLVRYLEHVLSKGNTTIIVITDDVTEQAEMYERILPLTKLITPCSTSKYRIRFVNGTYIQVVTKKGFAVATKGITVNGFVIRGKLHYPTDICDQMRILISLEQNI